jgi:hypothetical protein
MFLPYLGISCEGTPGECIATWEHYQDAAIQYCEEYPEECQQYLDAWVESLDTDAEE